jgi:hypothetical protein
MDLGSTEISWHRVALFGRAPTEFVHRRLDLTDYWLLMIDLLLQLAYVALVLAVISLFICTLPVWLIVLVAVLLLR